MRRSPRCPGCRDMGCRIRTRVKAKLDARRSGSAAKEQIGQVRSYVDWLSGRTHTAWAFDENEFFHPPQ
jgi:hypothetical protein